MKLLDCAVMQSYDAVSERGKGCVCEELRMSKRLLCGNVVSALDGPSVANKRSFSENVHRRQQSLFILQL